MAASLAARLRLLCALKSLELYWTEPWAHQLQVFEPARMALLDCLRAPLEMAVWERCSTRLGNRLQAELKASGVA